jgi:hypothetical protein
MRGATLAAALAAQVAWAAFAPLAAPRVEALPPAPPSAALQLAAAGDPVLLARLLMLRVAAHDDQAAGSLPLRALDYSALRAWLQGALDLDPRGQTPLLAASEIYAAVDDPVRARLMLDFVAAAFARDPARRWPWLAHAALAAEHRLHDHARALAYARALRTSPAPIPAWARELEALFASNAGELAAARAIIGGLLHDGQVTDPNELRFLELRLRQLEQTDRQPGFPLD